MSYQDDLQDDLAHARHEAGHALHAHLVGFAVERVVVGTHQGYTDIVQPITPQNLEERWAQSPLMASLELCRMLGTLRAGALCELACRDISGPDAAALALWQQAYVRHIGNNSDWVKLYGAVFERLSAWHRHQSVRSAVSHLAAMLLRQGDASRQAWLSMVEVAMVDALVPEPTYTPLFPSPTRPQSSQASTRSITPQVAFRATNDDAPARYSNTVPLNEDANRRIYALASDGERSLYRVQQKSSAISSYFVTRQVGMDGGKLKLETHKFTDEVAARRYMRLQAAR
jgi:hypothetical protein